MIISSDFSKLSYRNPDGFLYKKSKPISKIIGLDSEAYISGEPFMFCTSLGSVLTPDQIPQIFFTGLYAGANFVLYNMKYDSGALLYHLPLENLRELWANQKTDFDDVTYFYIPHKRLRLRKGNINVNFWDISQFYKSSLDKAAKTYLNESKIEIKTKRFRPDYVKRNWKSIAKYCIKDAELTGRLGQYLVDKLSEFNIQTTALYSCASLSLTYFTAHCRISTVHRFWTHYQEILKYACDAYEGGKFEITSRGYFPQVHEYDITSAYPYEIANLYDLKRAKVVHSPDYQSDAIYGFLRCRIENTAQKHLPCGPIQNNVRVYPSGAFFQTITKAEYDYLTMELDIPVEIIDGYWLMVDRKRRLYKGIIKNLFDLKSAYKGKDRMLYNNSKIIMNSFYGKTCQVTQTPDGKYRAGSAWNPIHAAYITAKTRIKVARIQNTHKDRCLGVHTDSVFLLDKLDSAHITGELGGFEYVTSGPTVLIACGMYQINDTCAFKGFAPRRTKEGKFERWTDILSDNIKKKRIDYRFIHVESWVEAMAKNHSQKVINVFSKAVKRIDLNCDTKQEWPCDMRAGDFLHNSQKGVMKIYVQPKNPWT